ncbi:variant-silencing SET domain-containing protein-like isoform X3 [Nylanderia fulva]|uniref:variant-silencing SET domain-containing protein-like isoform X2 n=1 Tax=Nylanderia fulva TaxID=613905 RepID=UPI0010FAF27E|nr:variant-silencing SET domain-containing protein-like isoform X2 [Nylanderia fulva]XP_029170503.1 variant-silencing SET domain-containing protein-like isoform X3 [Nylanderia fulva]
MSKDVKKTSDQKMKQKRREKDHDNKIHSMILKAREELDNVRKNNNEDRSRRPSHAKISNRLLPKPALGIYRNGSKGKDIKKESSESMFDRARLEADALKLFNGDTSESNYREEDLTHNETTNQSPNKSFVKNSLNWTQSTLEQSPILREKWRNQKTYPKKRHFFKNYNSDEIEKQNNESKYVAQKENIFKRKLFQNDKEQSKDIIATQMQTFDNDFMKENRINENRTQQTLEDNKNSSNKSKLYVKLCGMTSATNFEDSRSNKKGPLTTIITNLQHIFSQSQQRGCKKYKQQLEAVEYQTYNNLDTSLDSTSVIEYEVPNNSKNKEHNAEDGNIYLMQNDNVAHNSSTSLALQKAANFSLVNEEDSIQKDFNYIAHSSKDKRHNKDYFVLDLSKNAQSIDNRRHAETSTHSNDSMLLANKYSSDDYDSEEELTNIWKNTSAEVTNTYNRENVEQPVIHQYDERNRSKRNHSVERSDKNVYDEAYMERYNIFGIDINNKYPANERRTYVDSFSQQLLREKSKRELETVKSSDLSVEYQARTYSDASDALLISPNLMSTYKVNKISKYNENLFKFPSRKDVSQREDTYLAHSSNFPTPSIINKQFVNTHDRVESFKPQIESIELEDSQESLVNQFDINMHPNKLNGRNKLYPFHNLQTLETSLDTNLFMEQLKQERVKPLKKRFYLDPSTSDNFNVQSIQSLPQRTRQYTCENDDRKQELFKKTIRNPYQNILFNNSRAINHPSSTLNLSQTGARRRESTYEEIFNKPDMECSRNQTNSYYCHNQPIHFDSVKYQHKCHVSQARPFHEGALQSGILQVEDYNSHINNYINLSNNVQGIPSSLLQQQHATYLNVHDDQHCAAQNITQPVKYFAVSNNSNIQRIPIYISDKSIIENAPVVPLVKSNVQNTEEVYFHK